MRLHEILSKLPHIWVGLEQLNNVIKHIRVHHNPCLYSIHECHCLFAAREAGEEDSCLCRIWDHFFAKEIAGEFKGRLTSIDDGLAMPLEGLN